MLTNWWYKSCCSVQTILLFMYIISVFCGWDKGVGRGRGEVESQLSCFHIKNLSNIKNMSNVYNSSCCDISSSMLYNFMNKTR